MKPYLILALACTLLIGCEGRHQRRSGWSEQPPTHPIEGWSKSSTAANYVTRDIDDFHIIGYPGPAELELFERSPHRARVIEHAERDGHPFSVHEIGPWFRASSDVTYDDNGRQSGWNERFVNLATGAEFAAWIAYCNWKDQMGCEAYGDKQVLDAIKAYEQENGEQVAIVRGPGGSLHYVLPDSETTE
jgi:hypothetical protein